MSFVKYVKRTEKKENVMYDDIGINQKTNDSLTKESDESSKDVKEEKTKNSAKLDFKNHVTGKRNQIQKEVDFIDDFLFSHEFIRDFDFNTWQYNEIVENLKLAKRHLEDARMRFGKVLQHSEDSISIYDKEN